MKRSSRGYVAILLTVLVPLILYGTKWALDNATMNEVKVDTSKILLKEIRENLARKTALWVAKNYNPGVTLKRQKWALYKVADQFYNDFFSYYTDNSLINLAIPGIQRYILSSKGKGKGLDPILMKKAVLISDEVKIDYGTAPKYDLTWLLYVNRGRGVEWNLPFVSWKITDKLTNQDIDTYDKFDELDTTELAKGKYVLSHFDRYRYPHQWRISKADGYPTRTVFVPGGDFHYDVLFSLTSSSSDDINESGYTASFVDPILNNQGYTQFRKNNYSENGIYTYRTTPDDDRVKIAIAGDDTTGGKIEVTAKIDAEIGGVGYAVPAECNVDIILACPTNAAATNVNNYDTNSPTAGEPYFTTGPVTPVNDDIAATPIYQIGQGFRTFLKNFYHTRGVTVGLIPYSGKVSLDPEQKPEERTYVQNQWIDNKYFDTDQYNHVDSVTSENGQNKYPGYLRPTVLYGTDGEKDKALNSSYNWNTLLTGCPIMCRIGASQLYANNFICTGDLLDTSDPATDNVASGDDRFSYHFRRMNSNPCYGGYANLLSMKCEKNCTTYLPNPYYIIEPTADVQKVYEICGALYPFYDPYNVSNFLFIPITWANNLWRDWTRNPSCDAVEGADGQLSRPSKMTAGRKKVLILVVNKPDWFEPHELTYIGFDNDYSEIPLIESDCIRGDIKYNDTTQYFADGTPYNGTIQGTKKLLKLTKVSGSAPECTGSYIKLNGKYRLTFPKKYLVKIVMKAHSGDIQFSDLKDSGNNTSEWAYSVPGSGYGGFAMAYGNGRFVILSPNGYTAYSTDGVKWIKGDKVNAPSGKWNGLVWTGTHFVSLTGSSGSSYVTSSTDGATWSSPVRPSGISTTYHDDDLGWDGTQLFACADHGHVYTTTSKNGSGTWTHIGDISYVHDGEQFKYGGGYYVQVGTNGSYTKCYYSTTLLGSLSSSTLPFKTEAFNYGPGYWLAINKYGSTAKTPSAQASSWNLINGNDTTSLVYQATEKANWIGLCYGDNKWVMYTYDGTVAAIAEKSLSSQTLTAFNFVNINSTCSDTNSNRETTYFVEPSAISNSTTNGNYCIEFFALNIQLKSAEITNRPYRKITPTLEVSGNTSGTGQMYIKTNLPKLIQITASVPKQNTNSASFWAGDSCNMGTVSWKDFNGSKTFSTSNFWHGGAGSRNRSGARNRIRYSLSNVRIDSCILNNQECHFWAVYDGSTRTNANGASGGYLGGGYFESDAMVDNDGYNIRYDFYDVCHDNFYYDSDGHAVKFHSKNSSGWAAFGFKPFGCNGWIRGTMRARAYNGSGSADAWFGIGQGSYWSHWITMDRAGAYEIQLDITGNNDLLCKIEEYQDKSGYNYWYWIHWWTSTPRTLNDGVYLSGSAIQFSGTGNLTVKVSSTVTIYPNGKVIDNGKGTTTELIPVTSGDNNQIITLTPNTYEYKRQSDGTYKITLNLTNIKKISNIHFESPGPWIEFTKPRLPNHSRTIDFSKNINGKPGYDPNLIVFGTDNTGSLSNTGARYDSDYGYWITSINDTGNSSHCYWAFNHNKNIIGDFYFLTEDIGTKAAIMDLVERSGKLGGRMVPGLFRGFQHFDITCSLDYAYFDFLNISEGRNAKFVINGLTLPINTVLYHGASGLTAHHYQWQSDTLGNITTYDATTACGRVTLDALKKLKEDWGSNLRVYVILYKKQPQYKHKITGEEKEFDYDYFNESTINSYAGFDSDTYKVYEASDLDELNSRLKTIGDDIKTWAEYTEAKNVD